MGVAPTTSNSKPRPMSPGIDKVVVSPSTGLDRDKDVRIVALVKGKHELPIHLGRKVARALPGRVHSICSRVTQNFKSGGQLLLAGHTLPARFKFSPEAFRSPFREQCRRTRKDMIVSAEQIKYDIEAGDMIMKGVDVLANAVKLPPPGPRGRQPRLGQTAGFPTRHNPMPLERGTEKAVAVAELNKVGKESVVNARESFGFNAETEKYADLASEGVIDPAQVARFALRNAASAVSLFLTTESMIAEIQRKDLNSQAISGRGAGGMGDR